ncbi:MAG: class I SAM-dependent methyltransferase [Rhodocyclaceae bacterium]
MSFADHFSGHSPDYAAHRPDYPEALFSWLAAIAPGAGVAWDCGCGSGQAAGGLAHFFPLVAATDPSLSQLRHAQPAPGVAYACCKAEASPLPSGRINLIAVAQALHWFDLEQFYREALRVLAPEGVLAVWSYGEVSVDAAADAVIGHFYHDVVGPYWPPQRRHVENGYRDLPFPFAELPVPQLKMAKSWSLEQVVAYIGTWSATQRFMAATGADPLPELRRSLASVWGDVPVREVVWPMTIRAGKPV